MQSHLHGRTFMRLFQSWACISCMALFQSMPMDSARFMIMLRAFLEAAAKKGWNLKSASTAAMSMGLPGEAAVTGVVVLRGSGDAQLHARFALRVRNLLKLGVVTAGQHGTMSTGLLGRLLSQAWRPCDAAMQMCAFTCEGSAL